MGIYCASKAALSMLVQVAAAEWGALGIRVNAVAPGVTRTPMLGRGPAATVEGSPWLAGVAERTALGRLGEASDIAEQIIALHSMDWVTGQCSSATAGCRCTARSTPTARCCGRRLHAGGGEALTRPASRFESWQRTGSPTGAAWTRSPSHTMVSRSQAGRRTGVGGRLAGRPDERDHRGRRHVGPHGADGLRPLQQHADGVAQAVLHLDRRLLELHAGAHDGDHEVALGRALLHDVGQEAEEGGRRVVGVRQRLGVDGQRRQPIEQDGLAELLLGREVAVERPHAHARLLGDQVDRDLDPLDREDVLGGFEDAGPVALGVGPQRARAGGGRLVTPRLYLRTSVPREISPPPVDKRNSWFRIV